MTRRTIGIALFAGGVVLLVAGGWVASESSLFPWCLGGGIALFALADLIAPFPDESTPGPPHAGKRTRHLSHTDRPGR